MWRADLELFSRLICMICLVLRFFSRLEKSPEPQQQGLTETVGKLISGGNYWQDAQWLEEGV